MALIFCSQVPPVLANGEWLSLNGSPVYSLSRVPTEFVSQNYRSFQGVFKEILQKIKDQIFTNSITLKLNGVRKRYFILGVIHGEVHNFCSSLLPP